MDPGCQAAVPGSRCSRRQRPTRQDSHLRKPEKSERKEEETIIKAIYFSLFSCIFGFFRYQKSEQFDQITKTHSCYNCFPLSYIVSIHFYDLYLHAQSQHSSARVSGSLKCSFVSSSSPSAVVPHSPPLQKYEVGRC